jgi:hypothetical protein
MVSHHNSFTKNVTLKIIFYWSFKIIMDKNLVLSLVWLLMQLIWMDNIPPMDLISSSMLIIKKFIHKISWITLYLIIIVMDLFLVHRQTYLYQIIVILQLVLPLFQVNLEKMKMLKLISWLALIPLLFRDIRSSSWCHKIKFNEIIQVIQKLNNKYFLHLYWFFNFILF